MINCGMGSKLSRNLVRSLRAQSEHKMSDDVYSGINACIGNLANVPVNHLHRLLCDRIEEVL